jgi:hypothetical protein
MKKFTANRLETAVDYEAIIDGFDPAKWREGTPEELAEHRERAKNTIIVEIEESDANDTVEIEESDANDTVEIEEIDKSEER